MLNARYITISDWYMTYLGIGFCDAGFYAGWDGQGESNVEDCKDQCMKETNCRFIAYMNILDKKTCARYNKETCNLDSTTVKYNAKDHRAYAKTGLSVLITYLLILASSLDFHICSKIIS